MNAYICIYISIHTYTHIYVCLYPKWHASFEMFLFINIKSLYGNLPGNTGFVFLISIFDTVHKCHASQKY